MLAVLVLLVVSFAQHCSNAGGYTSSVINPGCSYRGFCGGTTCYCCNRDCLLEGIIGKYIGDNCEKVEIIHYADFGFLINDEVGVTCANDGSAASPDLIDVVTNVTGYDGIILSQPCKVCTQVSPCTEFENSLTGSKEPATSGILVKFKTWFNTFYNSSCPQDVNTFQCAENHDDGEEAQNTLKQGLTDNVYAELNSNLGKPQASSQMFYFALEKGVAGATRTRQPTSMPSPSPTSMPTPSPTLMPTPSPTPMPTPSPTPMPTPSPTPMPTPSPTPMPTQSPTPSPTHLPTPSPTPMPSQSPTPSPTAMPTESPTQSPTKVERITTVCDRFSHNIDNFGWVERGVGASCRGGISESWPGARTCKSPYLICLPEENTPADPFLNRTYFSNTHRYSVRECQNECRFDQRCRGFEFVADTNSKLGDCILIDDVDILVVDRPTRVDFEYNVDSPKNLDSSETGGVALCFHKIDTCNPYFNTSRLSDTMLSCYCPNNRKGSYTKKVKRTVSNTRYCGSDSEMDERIKLAHANRMFHLCENWCLFNTLNPEQESWYWDPWNTCWYETYSGPGAHRGYCDRVIRNPDSIELQFVNRRAQNFIDCGKTTTQPTLSPVEDVNVTYHLSAQAESCDDACAAQGKTCAADQTAQVFSSEAELTKVFSDAGFTCQFIEMNRTDWQGWALPGLGYGRICANRLPTLSHLEDLDSDCNRKIGNSWQRLCACY